MSAVDTIELNVGLVSEQTHTDIVESTDEIEPTPEELTTLEHVPDQVPLAAWLIIVCEFCERFAFIGLSGPFQNYIQFPVPGPGDDQPGALNRGHRIATILTTFLQFLCYLTPIFGAILADQFWGKYKTIVVACLIYVAGLLVLVLTSIPPAIHSGIAFPGLILSMIILGIGTGGVKSNVSPLMAEQYTRTKPVVKVIRGEKKIVDPKITLQSMFNWFYWIINLGGLSSIITTTLEKKVSYWLAYLVPASVFLVTLVVLLFGRNLYIRKTPTGSLIVRAGRITLTAIQTRWRLGKQNNCKHILDYAKEDPSSSHRSENVTFVELSTNDFIEDLKQAMSACRVFAFYPFYWLCYSQMNGNLVSQAAQMNVGVLPNDVLQNIDPIVLIIFIPIFDKLIYPTLRRFNIKFSSVYRITSGFICVSIAMAWTAYVQHLIYSTAPNYDYTTPPCSTCQKFNNISAAWQIPSYFLTAISEIFASITGLEYAFTQAPSSMKSVVMSLFLFTSAISSILTFALSPVIVDPKLLWMYASLSIMAFVVGILFFICFRKEHEKPLYR